MYISHKLPLTANSMFDNVCHSVPVASSINTNESYEPMSTVLKIENFSPRTNKSQLSQYTKSTAIIAHSTRCQSIRGRLELNCLKNKYRI